MKLIEFILLIVLPFVEMSPVSQANEEPVQQHQQPQQPEPLTLTEGLSAGRCRAWCGHLFSTKREGSASLPSSSSPQSDPSAATAGTTQQSPQMTGSECKSDANCTACWKLCEDLQTGGEQLKKAACSSGVLCRAAARSGCDAACSFETNEGEPVLYDQVIMRKIGFTYFPHLHSLKLSFNGKILFISIVFLMRLFNVKILLA